MNLSLQPSSSLLGCRGVAGAWAALPGRGLSAGAPDSSAERNTGSEIERRKGNEGLNMKDRLLVKTPLSN